MADGFFSRIDEWRLRLRERTLDGRRVRWGNNRPRIYFARAMDGLNHAEIVLLTKVVEQELMESGCIMLDTYVSCQPDHNKDAATQWAARVVESDLALMTQADGVLMDMSIPSRNYIGCACELVYAYLAGIPIAVYVGESTNETRPWLQYHATILCRERNQAIGDLAAIFD